MGVCLVISLLTKDIRKTIVKKNWLNLFSKNHKGIQILITYSIFLFFGVSFRAEKISDVFYIWSHLLTGWINPTRGMDFDDFVVSLECLLNRSFMWQLLRSYF
jgi:hypothetical protein